jgi:Na+-translocating ferredoxin:NAD+ oxidoreductase RnfD subunit/NAD-dependent dihydropyrimidine dehydrogenase PreA subunit
MSKPKEYSHMTKDKLMMYTLIALVIIAAVTTILWWNIIDYKPTNPPFTQQLGWSLGWAVIGNCLIAVGVAVGIDALLYKLTADSPLNTMSAAVFGMIVALSYSLAIPQVVTVSLVDGALPLVAPDSFVFIALIAMVGMVLFKKVGNMGGRKLVNPAAAAKLLVLLPFIGTLLLPADHTSGMPKLASPIKFDVFGFYLQSCFGKPTSVAMAAPTPNELAQTMILDKYHGWTGGASSIAVIIVGIALFIIARRYIKWRITLAYIGATVAMSLLMTAAYGGDATLRLMFELFIGSSIFLAFFMATDPASTPLTYNGQLLFGVGLAVITVLLQTFANFFGGSIVALIIMNVVAPKLDKVGKLKPTTESKEPKLPKAKAFPAEKVKTYDCMRCGACMRVCCHKLSPILIKQAFDKQDFDTLMKLHADYCTGCGHCTFVCPARIDVRKSVLMAKGALRGQ